MGPGKYAKGSDSSAVQQFADKLGAEYRSHARAADERVFGDDLGVDGEGPFQAALARLGTVQGFVVGLFGERSRAWSEFVGYCASRRAYQDQTTLGLSARFSHLVLRHRGFMIARLGRLAARAIVRCKLAVAAWENPIDRHSSSTRAYREMARHRQELASGRGGDGPRPARESLPRSGPGSGPGIGSLGSSSYSGAPGPR